MRRRNRPFLPLLVFILLVSPVTLQLAYGYLDPGTGSYIIQLLVGGLLGGLFAIGLFWKRVIAFVKRLFKPRKNDAGNSH
jgi:membrane associated rhomboid family serine protease